MPAQKYDYNIQIIIDGLNSGLKLEQIAKSNGWPFHNMMQWLKRNYVKAHQYHYVPRLKTRSKS